MRRVHDLLVAVLMSAVVVVLTTTASWAISVPGHVSARDRTLRPGCHAYHYHYVVTPGTGDWELEPWLFDPRGKQVGYGYFLVGGDPLDNHPACTVCRSDVVPGRFTIKATLHWYDPPLLPIL